MRRWERARIDRWCGRCLNRMIRVGDPILLIESKGRTFVRCQSCSGAPDIEQLEAFDVREEAARASTTSTPQPQREPSVWSRFVHTMPQLKALIPAPDDASAEEW